MTSLGCRILDVSFCQVLSELGALRLAGLQSAESEPHSSLLMLSIIE
jgi:hypothetical protein